MSKYKYILDKSSKKFICPQCNKKRFVRYINTESSEYIPEEYGKCDRQMKCGYENNPYKAGFHKNNMAKNGQFWQNLRKNEKKIQRFAEKEFIPLEPIPQSVLLHTLKDYEKNNFIHYLCCKYGPETVTKQIEAYLIGTVNEYTSFAFIDINGICRAISLIQYDTNCKRNKHNDNQARNIHTFLKTEYRRRNQNAPEWLNRYLQNESKFSCLFGEHLLSWSDSKYKPIALVEAPKTAFIASMVYDSYIWISVGSLYNLTYKRVKSIIGREVYLFPDTSNDGRAFHLWNEKAKQLGFTCVDILENISTPDEKKKGYDLADYLLEYDFTKNDLDRIVQNMQYKKEIPATKMGIFGGNWGNLKCSGWENKVQTNQIIDLETINQQDIKCVMKCPTIELFENSISPAKTKENSEITANEYEINRSITDRNNLAYIGVDGTLYIPTPPHRKTYTRYSKGVQAYNERSQTPDFVETIPAGTKQVIINLKTLTI